MKFKILFSFLSFFLIQKVASQVTLDADGSGNTYEKINAVLAPGFDVIEVPDCNHTAFGRHIDEIFDSQLDSNVFRFFIHVTPDNDRCINYDRQRNEIKAYDKSPDNLKGIEGETVTYKWKFKLDAGFQSSTSFTHLHQLKSVGGTLEGMPMYTLSTRKGSPDQFELRYAETDTQVTLKKTNLQAFKGTWVDVTETIKYGISGTYSIEIKRVSDGVTLFDYSNNSIINWRIGANFVRPKWGIYRSLNSPSDLRDESVLFANFSIAEALPLSVSKSEINKNLITTYPNPAKNALYIKETIPNVFNHIIIVDNLGRIIKKQNTSSKAIDISNLKKGLYFIEFKKDNKTLSVEKFLVN